jgi:extradiol dioxygenase family protein
MINIRGIDHLVLRAVNVEQMLSFYCNALGCTVERRQDEMGPVESRYGAEGEGPSIYLTDPDGNAVELKGPARPADVTMQSAGYVTSRV